MRAVVLVLLYFVSLGHCGPRKRSGGRVGGRAPQRRPPSSSVRNQRNARTATGNDRVHIVHHHGISSYGYNMNALVGLQLFDALLRERRRHAYLQQQLQIQMKLGEDEARIQQLQEELKEQSAKVEGLANKAAKDPDIKQVERSDHQKNKKLRRQIEKQQEEIERLQLKKLIEEQAEEIKKLKHVR
mmetsp:Transcript_50849/g.80600  ORF Transcript_50849/g.80600 Transcript_50849/m.80600 type:complete len:186 (+) Transcript_50849:62-619(+)